MGTDIVVVAIPEADDPVWKVSSEKVPHLTLLYMKGPLNNQENTIRFVEHVVKTSLSRFGLSVDRRGTLGADDADVLFFDKSYGGKELIQFRGYLLGNTDIVSAYRKAEQYPTFTPHLTLGYPATPANPNPNDYGIHWVNFDKIAVWTGDYDGPEFILPKNSDMEIDIPESWSEDGKVGESLEHFGVRGMKWGVRRSVGSNGLVRPGVSINGAASLSNPGNIRVTSRKDHSATESEAKAIGDATKSVQKSLLVTNRKNVKKIMTKVDSKYDPLDLAQSSSTRQKYDQEMSTALTKYAQTKTPKEFDSFVRVDNDEMALYVGTREWVKDVYKGPIRHSEDVLGNKVVFKIIRDDDGFIIDFEDDLKQSENFEDVLMHFGVRGMKWGVRRPTNSSGLVVGSVSKAIKDGQSPRAEIATARNKGQRGASQSEDHKKMVENLNKKIENLSTNEIRAISERLKAIKNFEATTKAQKEAKASLGKKLSTWALTNVREGARRGGESWIQEQTGGLVKEFLPDFKKSFMDSRKNRNVPTPTNTPATKSKTVDAEFLKKDTPEERQKAIEQLVYNITTLPKEE